MTKKKLLITGNCGFIFGNFVRWLLSPQNPKSADYKVIGVDRVNGNANNLYVSKAHTFHPADIRDQHVMDKIFQFEQPDFVIHGAAEFTTDPSPTNDFITSNVLGTQSIINCCLKNKVKKLVFISTDEVYGQLVSESDPPWKESAPFNPRNPYSASKASGELLVRAAHQSHGLTYNITRSSNNYGVRQSPNKLIPKVFKCILKEEKIPVYGQGLQIRDWLHVSDNCAAILSILENGKPNEAYNISANQELSNIELVQRICNIMGKGHSLIDFTEDRPGHDFRYAMDATKIKELGWKPMLKLRDALEPVIGWYIANNWWFN